MACPYLQRLGTPWWRRRVVDTAMEPFFLKHVAWVTRHREIGLVYCASPGFWVFVWNIFVQNDEIQIAVYPLKLKWQRPLVLLKYSYIGKRNIVMASIFECINHWTMFLFTFLMINLIARLIACHFFFLLISVVLFKIHFQVHYSDRV